MFEAEQCEGEFYFAAALFAAFLVRSKRQNVVLKRIVIH